MKAEVLKTLAGAVSSRRRMDIYIYIYIYILCILYILYIVYIYSILYTPKVVCVEKRGRRG